MVFCRFQFLAKLFEICLTAYLPNLRKHFALFLFLGMMLDVFHQYCQFGLELFAIGLAIVYLF